MTDEEVDDKPTPEVEVEGKKDDDEESSLDDLIESIVEIPHFLFRKFFGKKE